jgi:HD-GYP domain-containing protein (c-di-GMP phosphodiesterase class II)
MIPREYNQGAEHRCTLENIKAPFVVKRISLDSKGKLDDTIDRADLYTYTHTVRVSKIAQLGTEYFQKEPEPELELELCDGLTWTKKLAIQTPRITFFTHGLNPVS